MIATSPKSSTFAVVAATAMALAPAAALIFFAPGASAQTRALVASFPVAVATVQIGPAEADATIRARVETAAGRVCAAVASHSPLLPREHADCVSITVTEAMEKLERQGEIPVADAR